MIAKAIIEVRNEDENFTFSKSLKIQETVSNTFGKWPLFYGGVALLDYKAFQSILALKLNQTLTKVFQRDDLKDLNFLQDPILTLFKKEVQLLNDITFEANINFKN